MPKGCGASWGIGLRREEGSTQRSAFLRTAPPQKLPRGLLASCGSSCRCACRTYRHTDPARPSVEPVKFVARIRLACGAGLRAPCMAGAQTRQGLCDGPWPSLWGPTRPVETSGDAKCGASPLKGRGAHPLYYIVDGVDMRRPCRPPKRGVVSGDVSC